MTATYPQFSGRTLSAMRDRSSPPLALRYFRLTANSGLVYKIVDADGTDTGLTDANVGIAYYPDPEWSNPATRQGVRGAVLGVPGIIPSSANVGGFCTWRLKVQGGTEPYSCSTGDVDGAANVTITQVDTWTFDIKVKVTVTFPTLGAFVPDISVTDGAGSILDIGAVLMASIGAVGGTVTRGVQIPDSTAPGTYHPHVLDIYTPTTTLAGAMVLLHGGGGDQVSFAQDLGILASSNVIASQVNWPLLLTWRSLVIIPQGQACIGNVNAWNPNGVDTRNTQNPNGVRTWSNGFMWSGANDEQFLVDLADWIFSTYGAIGRRLCGHSNGGMMTSWMWYFHPNKYTKFCASSGPTAYNQFAGKPFPHTIQPFFQQMGQFDEVLMDGTGTEFNNAVWTQNGFQAVAPAKNTLSVADQTYPQLGQWIGENVQFTARANADGGIASTVTKSIKIGTQTTYTSAGGNMVLQVLSNASHEIRQQPGDTLPAHQTCTGRHVFSDWAGF